MKPKLIFLMAALALIQCKKEVTQPDVDLGYEYFPHEIGKFAIYDVTEIQLNDFTQSIDTVNYQIKELFLDTFTNLQGQKAYQVSRFIRTSNLDTRKISKIFSVTVLPTRVEHFEENVKLVNLIFPVNEGLRWNGNAFNNLGEEFFEYEDFKTDTVINGIAISNYLTVNQYFDENILERNRSFEKYAKHIGLIHKYFEQINLQKDSGVVRYSWITQFGVE